MKNRRGGAYASGRALLSQALLLLLPLLVLPAGHAAAQDAPAPASAPAAVELFLEASLNGDASGAVARFVRTPAGTLRSTLQDLRDLGLDTDKLGLRGAPDLEVDLDAVPGLSYTWDNARQSIALRLADTLRTPLQLDARPERAVRAGSASPGLLLNYDLYAQSGSGASRVAALNELRYFDARGVFSTSGVATLHGAGRRYLRHDTSWSWADPVALSSLQVGDLVNRSLTWTRSLRMAGIEWRKNFELRPDLVTYPVADLKGSAVVPSSVSLYVNGMQQFNAQVPDGPFVLNGITGLNGAGQATVVTRDALGREVATTLPLYIDTRLLAAGLSDYALAFGVPRRDFGARSFGYAGRPLASASLRHGYSETLTLEAHLEAGRRLVNGGAGALLRVGQLGVLQGALAASSGAGRGEKGGGMLASAGYQYLSAGWSLDAQSTRSTRAYADLGTAEGSPVARANDRVSLNVALPGGQSLSASYIGYRPPGQDSTRLASLAWSARLGIGAYFNAYLSVNAYQDLRRHATRGVAATLNLGLPGRVGASAGAGSRDGARTWNASLSRAADFGGGLGWSVQDADQGGGRFSQGQLNYLGRAGQVSALVQRGGGTVTRALGATGAVVAMDGTLLAARQVGRAFALVSTGLADVPVLQENRRIGRTDAGGHFLVPDLVPYTANMLSIDTTELPVDFHVRGTSQELVPQRASGIVARFAVERYVAASVIVHGADGRPAPLGTMVEIDGGAPTVVGYDGVVFVDGARPANRLVLRAAGGACEVRFNFNAAQGAALAPLGPLACAPLKENKGK
ncbi:fimbria/pilus outer membrane usher protein [Massilia sp. CFBP 13647]|uniref:fimbria/pilus outer membrane usher protein n=1 Tax=Massilia sp. CFBP 13647 TaxID=2775276 RepID=UPI00178370D6|nr:fimbria/pilus outer membrane usher protein [Massilia sp. CFBP 13647]MBD8528617.1 fimbrial biogenesis outer membrane usher protein [Massilia sp. CFBP 13647]